MPTRVASLWIGSRLRLDSNAQVLHLDSEDKIMACIAIGEGFHMVHNGCSSIEFPHCQHSTCTNAHRSSIASTIVDDASTRPEPFVQHFSICELCSACIDNTISSNDHPAHGGASWCVIWLARPILLGMTLQDFLLPSDVRRSYCILFYFYARGYCRWLTIGTLLDQPKARH